MSDQTTKQCPVCFGFGFIKREDGTRTVCEECDGDGEVANRHGELEPEGETE